MVWDAVLFYEEGWSRPSASCDDLHHRARWSQRLFKTLSSVHGARAITVHPPECTASNTLFIANGPAVLLAALFVLGGVLCK